MPFDLGTTSHAHLEGVHASLVRVVTHAAVICPVEFTVFEGVRTPEIQARYLKEGVTKTLDSRHLIQADGFGHAVDLVPWIAGGPRWEWTPIYKIAVAMRDAAMTEQVALTWGGVWDKRLITLPGDPDGIQAAVKEYSDRHPGPDFIDGPHFELAA